LTGKDIGTAVPALDVEKLAAADARNLLIDCQNSDYLFSTNGTHLSTPISFAVDKHRIYVGLPLAGEP
jgi:hypothetical protein